MDPQNTPSIKAKKNMALRKAQISRPGAPLVPGVVLKVVPGVVQVSLHDDTTPVMLRMLHTEKKETFYFAEIKVHFSHPSF